MSNNCCCNPSGLNSDQMKAMADLWDRVDREFATNDSVRALARELKQLEAGINVSTNRAATTAAALVLKALKEDLEKTKMMHTSIEIVPFVTNQGFPSGVKEPRTDCIYVTPAERQDRNLGECWDEWIVVPGEYTGSENSVTWERIGNKRIDLTWVREDIKKINHELGCLCSKVQSTSKMFGKILLDQAIRPLKELQKYIHSEEYIKFVFEKLPRAALGSDGLMTSGQYTLLALLAQWVSQDHKVVGGGALGPDYVLDLFDKNGVSTEELRKKYNL